MEKYYCKNCKITMEGIAGDRECPECESIMVKVEPNTYKFETNNKCKCGGVGIYDVHLETCDQTNNRIREEWQEEFNNKFEIDYDGRPCFTKSEIRDFIDSLLKIQEQNFLSQPANEHDNQVRKFLREEMIEKIENLPLILEEGNERHKIFADGFETARDNIINLIKESK